MTAKQSEYNELAGIIRSGSIPEVKEFLIDKDINKIIGEYHRNVLGILFRYDFGNYKPVGLSKRERLLVTIFLENNFDLNSYNPSWFDIKCSELHTLIIEYCTHHTLKIKIKEPRSTPRATFTLENIAALVSISNGENFTKKLNPIIFYYEISHLGSTSGYEYDIPEIDHKMMKLLVQIDINPYELTGDSLCRTCLFFEERFARYVDIYCKRHKDDIAEKKDMFIEDLSQEYKILQKKQRKINKAMREHIILE